LFPRIGAHTHAWRGSQTGDCKVPWSRQRMQRQGDKRGDKSDKTIEAEIRSCLSRIVRRAGQHRTRPPRCRTRSGGYQPLDGCRHEARLEGDVSLPKAVNGGSVTQFDKRRHLLCHSPFVDLCQNMWSKIRRLIRGNSGAKIQLRFRGAAIILPALLLQSEAKSSRPSSA
jgi:hypothetical protein